MKIYHLETDSPVGKLYIFTGEHALLRISWDFEETAQLLRSIIPAGETLHWNPANTIGLNVVQQLQDYFDKRRTRFVLPLDARGPAFQQEVWNILQKIPFGETWSYQRLARKAGRPRAVRAVGGANGRNPIPIIIPCHRVIQKDGKIGGYGGGIPVKEWLLRHEGFFL